MRTKHALCYICRLLTLGLQIFCQYREHAAFLWRGFTVQQMAHQCFGNAGDPSKGRQMPIHYGSAELNMVTVSSVVATQAPHAVGAAYALKVCFRCVFGPVYWSTEACRIVKAVAIP